MKEQFLKLAKNKNYIYILIASSGIISCSYTLPTLLDDMITPYGYTSDDASQFGELYNLFGIIGGVLFAMILLKYPMFKIASLIFTPATLITFVLIQIGID